MAVSFLINIRRLNKQIVSFKLYPFIMKYLLNELKIEHPFSPFNLEELFLYIINSNLRQCNMKLALSLAVRTMPPFQNRFDNNWRA